ncbi:hypothetical protein NM22_07245 [Vibrio tubiashii]|nr:hypothetical protein NM22_07245 [Vibrio tubiashii]
MGHVYLFDWGDTLMVDFPNQPGKMFLWPHVEAVKQAEETLKQLSKQHTVYVATSAQDSSETDIQRAFERVGLAPYINGYFCKANLGLEKNSCDFYRAILSSLDVEPSQVTMVGDTLETDVYPARNAGLNTVFYNPNQQPTEPDIATINHLKELLSFEQ